jgi:hypothetical protein
MVAAMEATVEGVTAVGTEDRATAEDRVAVMTAVMTAE